jgi:heme/copper-type cytochrome/quinol oxidase subunit 1
VLAEQPIRRFQHRLDLRPVHGSRLPNGPRDVAFPRLNALTFWLFVFGGMAFYLSLFFEPPEAGWTSYPPLSNSSFLGSGGIDAWIFLIHLTGASTVIGEVRSPSSSVR